ncbi:putative helicase MOV-10 isoform X2 [Corticium candelabrum]|nr:putative helicase MOV-10 isoform X2 [Corticium candelabrum]
MADHRIGCRRPYSGMSVGGHDDSKYGVSVTGMLDAGEIFIGQTTSVRSLVRNESHENITMLLCKSVQDGCSVLVFTPCSLKEPTCEAAVVAAAGLSSFETEHSAKVTQFPVDLVPGHECIVEMTIFGSDVGYAEHKMEFIFAKFVITRTLSVTVCDPLEAAVTPSIPYKRSCHAYHYEDNSVSSLSDGLPWHVPGRRPIRTKPRSFPNKLPEYPVSARLRACVIDQENIVDVCPSIGRALTMDSYSQRFSSLLHIEEVQIEINMGEFDMAEVTMEKQGSYFQLPVPGLAEGRPSLLVGDKVIATVPGKGHSEPSYEGYIHEVYGESILLQFSEDFHRNFQNEDYDILFTFNRTPLRRCLQAVEFAKNLSAKVLFPGKISPMSPIASVPMKGTGRKEKTRKCGFFNLSLNERQKEAVQHIVSGRGRPAPYILFGPPGTGKTVTLVEGILQVLHCIPSSRVIACTPSNSAADLIAERLHLSGVIGQGDMARLNAYQRQKDPPDCILPYCHTPDDLDLVSRYRVVVSTCVTAGTLYCLGLNVGHFTHVFVDEAGQATEPESLIAVNFAAGSDSQIILTGDPFQLGAVVQSAVAKTHGLDVSLLERLTNRLCYQRDERQYAISGNYNPLCVTKLINNYRSHPALLVLPSDTFYDGELVPFADRKITHFLCGWEHLPNKNNFPILFHGIRGKDVREGSSPSWFNPVEAVQVTKYVQALLSGSYGVQGHHIGVITPYRKQVEKIRLLLNRLGVDGIKVGSVEEFQGQERRVIILSTVRSSSSQVGFDVRHCLGFLSNPKRFNVAITRAQALLLVVGDPFVLTTDRLWWSFVRYCYDHNAYIGVDIGNLNLNNFEEDEICDGTVDGSAADKESDAN